MCQVESKLGDMVDWLCVSRDRGPGAVGAGSTGNGSGEGSAQEEVHICTGCEENAAASSYCTDCPEWLCDQCVQAHRRVRVTKDHTIEPKENLNNRPNSASSSSSSTTSSSAQATLFCPQHLHEPLKLFCESCDKLTCRDCQLGEHKDHKYQFVNEASTQYKQFLQILLTKIKEKQTYIENAYQLIHKRHQEIEEREKVVLNDIKAFAKRLMSEVNNRGKQLVTDLHSICTAKKAQLGYKQKAIVTLSGQLEHSLLMAEKILECNNTAAMLSSKKLLVQHLKHLLRTRCEVPNPYHVVDINLQYDEDLICGHLAKQGALVVDGVTYRGPRKITNSTQQGGSGAGQSSQSQSGQQLQRPLQPIAPKMVGQGAPPNLSSFSIEQRAALLKTIAGQQLQQVQGSNSPTSTMATPRFPGSVRSLSATSTAASSPSSSNGPKSKTMPAKTFHPFMPVPQSNTVSSTQVVKTGGVYYPPSGLPQMQQQQQQQQHAQQPPGPRRTLTVQQQLQHQRQRLQEQQHQQHRYQQHMSQIKQQMDKMVLELQRQQNMGGPPGAGGSGGGTPGAIPTPKGIIPPHPLGQAGSRGGGMGNPSMANAIIIQPASSTGHYPGISSSTQPGFVSQSVMSNGRDQLTPSPNLRTSPLSQGSRNEVSPVGSLCEGLGNASDSTGKQSSSISISGNIKQEQLSDLYSPMIGSDGALCIKPEPRTPGTDPVLPLSYPTDLNYDDAFFGSLRDKPVDMHNTEISDSAVETTQRTPPPSHIHSATNQDQPYNLCKPITDQVIGCQRDGDATEVLDLSRSGSGDSEAGSRSQLVLGTVSVIPDDQGYNALVESEPLPLRDPDDPSEDYCAVCQNGGELLCCDTCPKVFHLKCHVPTLTAEPSGAWSCGLCAREQELKIETALPRPFETTGSKRKMSMERLLDKELKVCQRILLELFCHKASPLFHEPVPKLVPNYHKIISTPMDLGTIKGKLARTHGPRYITIDDFLGDIQLVFSNCNVFNDSVSAVGKAGKIAEDFFHNIVNKYLPYFRAWTAAPHDLSNAVEPKIKRRKTTAKDPKEPRSAKGQHVKVEKSLGKPPVLQGKANRKTPDKPNDQTESELMPTTIDDTLGAIRDLSTSYQPGSAEMMNIEEDSEDALIRNLGLIRQQCEQILPTEPEPRDLPSDPVIDPNNDHIDSSRGLMETEEAVDDLVDAGKDCDSPKVYSELGKVESDEQAGESKSDGEQFRHGSGNAREDNAKASDDNEPMGEANDPDNSGSLNDCVANEGEAEVTEKNTVEKVNDTVSDGKVADGKVSKKGDEDVVSEDEKEGNNDDTGDANGENDSAATAANTIEMPPSKEKPSEVKSGDGSSAKKDPADLSQAKPLAGLETRDDAKDAEQTNSKKAL